MHSTGLRIALNLLLATGSLACTAQDLSDKLTKATALTDLDSITEKPWALKMEVTVFDAKGKNPQTGTVEVKRNGNDRRTVFDFPSGRRVDLITGGRHFQSYTGVIPYYAEVALRRVLHPGPNGDDLSGAELKLEHETVSKIPFDCIMLSHTMQDAAIVPFGIFPAFCFRHDTDDLRVVYNYAGQVTVVNTVGKFLDHVVPVSLSINDQDLDAARVKVTSLGVFTPSAQDFTPSADELAQSFRLPTISGGDLASRAIDRPSPQTTMASRRRGAKGAVVMRVVVGRDGHVHDIRPMTFPDPDLVAAAMVAVRLWTYKPYLVDEVPTDVEATITINFAGNAGVEERGIRH